MCLQTNVVVCLLKWNVAQVSNVSRGILIICRLLLIDDIEKNSAEKDAALPKEQAPLLSDENKSGTESE